jgi:uncharacterized membrane protein
MSLRSPRERALQTLAFETGGLLVATPLYALIFGAAPAESFLLLAVIAAAELIWTPTHNALFDLAEWRLARRVASDRPHALRVVHAFSCEITAMVVSLPVIMLIGGHGFWAALAIDFGLSALYILYGYVFHLGYDRLRPVARPAVRPVAHPAPTLDAPRGPAAPATPDTGSARPCGGLGKTTVASVLV